MGHAPLERRRARIGDEADLTHDAGAVEQHRQHDGMARDPGADLAPRQARVVDRLADVFGFVVEAGGNLVQTRRLRPAFGKVRPFLDALPRRTAIAAAGQIAEAVERHRLRLQPELEPPDFAGVGALRQCGRARDEDKSERPEEGTGVTEDRRCGHFL